jgi:hypothetical protein
MSILSSQSKRCRILVMNFMNILVEWSPMKCTMSPVMKGIFHDEENGDLPDHCTYVGEGDVDEETKVSYNGVEEIDLGEFDGEVLEENVFCAGPLVGRGRDLGLNVPRGVSIMKSQKKPLLNKEKEYKGWVIHLGVSSDGRKGLHQ